MKSLLKVFLPSVFFLAFGISMMFMASACEKEDGSKCAKCDSDADCDSGLNCYLFSDGEKRCAESAGDLCVGIWH